MKRCYATHQTAKFPLERAHIFRISTKHLMLSRPFTFSPTTRMRRKQVQTFLRSIFNRLPHVDARTFEGHCGQPVPPFAFFSTSLEFSHALVILERHQLAVGCIPTIGRFVLLGWSLSLNFSTEMHWKSLFTSHNLSKYFNASSSCQNIISLLFSRYCYDGNICELYI